MLLSDRILYLVEFDAIEPLVTAQVSELSKALGGAVVLLATVPPRSRLLGGNRQAEIDARMQLESIAQRLQDQRARVLDSCVLQALPEAAVHQTVDRYSAEYIVLGAGEESTARRQHISQLALKITQNAHQHVWVCKPTADPVLEHILCCYDGSRGSGAAIRLSCDIARQFNARMQLLSVFSPPTAEIVFREEIERQEADESARVALIEEREGYLQGFGFEGVTLAKNYVFADRASESILEEAVKHPEGLLVLGAAGLRRFSRMRLGNTAQRVLETAESSVLVVK